MRWAGGGGASTVRATAPPRTCTEAPLLHFLQNVDSYLHKWLPGCVSSQVEAPGLWLRREVSRGLQRAPVLAVRVLARGRLEL